jgi:NAD(P)-dependent dehydrogenase (short-subunit alcohol dehydrogenase family)
VVGLSETLAKDLAPHRIGVSVLCPMGVATRIRAAARNRPPALRNEVEAEDEPVELMGGTLAPPVVAEMVLEAVRENRLYVITHAEGLEPLRRRLARMERAILEQKR